jgi:hypothetical protein
LSGFFTATLAFTSSFFLGLLLPLGKAHFNVVTISLTFAWIIAGIVAGVFGVGQGVSPSFYPQLLGLADAGVAAALVAAVVVGIRAAVIAERRRRKDNKESYAK